MFPKIIFEEKQGKCENASIFEGICLYKGQVRRTLHLYLRAKGRFFCPQCMPEFFSNPNQHLVVRVRKGPITDPLFEDYKVFYEKIFQTN